MQLYYHTHNTHFFKGKIVSWHSLTIFLDTSWRWEDGGINNIICLLASIVGENGIIIILIQLLTTRSGCAWKKDKFFPHSEPISCLPAHFLAVFEWRLTVREHFLSIGATQLIRNRIVTWHFPLMQLCGMETSLTTSHKKQLDTEEIPSKDSESGFMRRETISMQRHSP